MVLIFSIAMYENLPPWVKGDGKNNMELYKKQIYKNQ